MRLRQRRTPTIDVKQPVEWKHPLNQGLVAWYLCHPQLAGTGLLYDLCNTGNLSRAGALTGMAAPYSSTTSGWRYGGGRIGGFGSGLSFDASDDHVEVGTSFGLNVPLTIMAWFRPAAVGSNLAIASIGTNGGVSRFQLTLNTTPNLLATSVTSGGVSQAAQTSATVSANQWQHATGVFLSSSSRSVFLNGRNKVTDTNTAAVTGINITNIGIRWSTTRGLFFNGMIDDVRIYNRALSDAEVRAVYETSLSQYPGVLRRMRNVAYSFASPATSQGNFFAVI